MESNREANAVHRNHLKLDIALQYDQTGVAQCMEPAVREAVRAMADRIAPLIKAADNVEHIRAMEDLANAAHAQTKRTTRRLRSTVESRYEVVPVDLERLRRMQLGNSGQENGLILRALLHGLSNMPGFEFPPGLSAADVEAVIRSHDNAFGDWKAAKLRAADATAQLIVMRPQVKRLWEEYGLKAWIMAHVRQPDQQQLWGLPAKRRNRRPEQEEQVVTTTPATGTSPLGSVGVPTNITVLLAEEGRAPPAVPAAGLFAPPGATTPAVVKNGMNGTNGHDVGAPI